MFRAVTVGHELGSHRLEGPPYLGFLASHDVQGDGSVVVAQAGGHTPCSVVVFVSVPFGDRDGVVGDLTWQLDGVERACRGRGSCAGWPTSPPQAHGPSLRDHIVLGALHRSPGLSQVELGRTLRIGKTTLIAGLDRLERSSPGPAVRAWKG